MEGSSDGLTDVGLVGISVYFPRRAVAQTDLEVYDSVSRGKYTTGLGQVSMAVVHENEDVVSMCMTVLQMLVETYGISYNDIGRLEVGTETLIDKCKSVKTSLMALFEESGNHEVEGLDNNNACYGSTSALFNTLAWAESSAWDGRYGVVIAGDIAVYAQGTARPTGGAGAVAMLLGRGVDAPIRFEIGLRASCFAHTYDFFKPRFDSEYPIVNGQETVDCYVRALDACYALYRRRAEKLGRCRGADRTCGVGNKPKDAANGLEPRRFSVEQDVDYCVFHAPFDKMVQRAIARLVYNEFMDTPVGADVRYKCIEKHRCLERSSSHRNREAMRDFVSFTNGLYREKCGPATWLSREIGNAYTASLFATLAALIVRAGNGMAEKRILLFAFGSGFASSMYSMRVVGSLDQMMTGLSYLKPRLDDRIMITPEQFNTAMKRREAAYGRIGYIPSAEACDELFPGTYYVLSVDEQGRRTYKRSPKTMAAGKGSFVCSGQQ